MAGSVIVDEAVVRRAGAGDIPELVRLRHAMFRAMAAAGAAGRPDQVEDAAWYLAAGRALDEQMRRGVLAAFVVDAPGPGAGSDSRPLVACAVASLEERLPGPGFPRGLAGSMSSVFVEPTHRGRGVARAVVSAGVAWLDEQGAEVVDLHATPQAEALYRSLGFAEPASAALRRLSRRS